ncbi:LysR family transcriptional regulator [Bradyrhizobium sp. UFLA05-109]
MAKAGIGNARPRGRRLQFSFNQLEYVIAAAEHGSFRQAAEELSIKQSTLSRSVQSLESTFGIAIFERSSGGVQVTAEGRHFLRSARSIVEQLEVMVTTARGNAKGDADVLVIGFCTPLTAGTLRATLLDFRRKYPLIEVRTIGRSGARLAAALRNSVVDIYVIAEEISSPDCKTTPLWSEAVFVELPDDHELAKQEAVHWTDLRDQTVLLSQEDLGLGLETLLAAKLKVPDDRPQIQRHDVSRDAIKSLISIGMGVSLLLESDIGADFPGLAYRPLRDGAGPSCIGLSAVWRSDNKSEVLANFLKLLSERRPVFSED